MRAGSRGRLPGQAARRAREFEAFVAGAAPRLLHTATLFTAEPQEANPQARRLAVHALAHTYAAWERLSGEDPYAYARGCLALRYARTTWYPRRLRKAPAQGVLALLEPRERLIVVLRMFEGVAEEQCAALLGLPRERVAGLCAHACATLLHPPRERADPAGAVRP
ncbi:MULTISPECIES: sigma factor-like helix-turn-helix DNA-binding protein [Streptomyces]|uniref:DNA-binding protein n=1 Tax=Streptomyces albus (strain ATCC 21838 / DSM 41398 / FERM P-419 / JCM 4703 / NBRC 107858) TaxID=1081613 RepID=A0A0B5ER21_STRA4|nr:sigma factor-like helix-turn-helix DNA-binding protein [Streptomyces sp. SCSIO ZS0520]AJE85258.1 DNA-binding protein [Streptomyces albus]AOU79565.1 DNA-binding protein [Streptomyces albus]AYN35288.1 DNA-binding protein [Streptomyces albus]